MIKRLAPSSSFVIPVWYKTDGKPSRFMFLTYTRRRNPSTDSPARPSGLLGYDLNKQRDKYLCLHPFRFVYIGMIIYI